MAIEFLVAYPGLDLAQTSALVMTNNSTDPNYVYTNLQTYRPTDVAKATGTSSVLTWTHGASRTPAGIGIMNHNLFGRTVTLAAVGGGGLSQALTIPARSADGQCTNVWFDLRGMAAAAAGTSHTLTISGGSGAIAIGRICLPTQFQVIRYAIGRSGHVEYTFDWPSSIEFTNMLVDMTYDKGIRIRKASGQVKRTVDGVIIKTLLEYAKGANIPFMVVPNAAVNDCWYAKADQTELESNLTSTKVQTTRLAVRELSMGLPL